MMSPRIPHRQQGAVLVVGMVMLVLFTLLVTSAYTLSSTNAQAVANMQYRAESIAAANKALEMTIGSWDFGTALPENDIDIDIDNNGSNDYTVTINPPVCKYTSAYTSVSSQGGGQTGQYLTAAGYTPSDPTTTSYAITFDIQANVKSISTGSTVIVHQGMSMTRSQAVCTTLCGSCS